MGKIRKGLAAVVLAAAAAEAGGTAYFFRRTVKRNRKPANVERTMKMSGTDWGQYSELLQTRKEAMLARAHEDVYLQSSDGLKLHATWFPMQGSKKTAICFHGYTSQGMSDYVAISDYYFRNGYNLLLPDQRAHGESEGEYVGFGCLDRYDALLWMDWVVKTCGEDVKILLHGTSMGGATVLMASGLSLPPQVKGIVSDCAFTSAKEVFSHVLKSMYHIPPFPLLEIADVVNRKVAGYGLDECNAAREVRKAKVPIFFVHGEADGFVPCWMCDELYDNCASPKTKLIVPGAAHAESYYKDMEGYEKGLDALTGEVMK